MRGSQAFPLPWETLPWAPKRHGGIPPGAEGQGTARDTGLWVKNTLHPSSPQQDAFWTFPTMLGPPGAKGSQHAGGSKPRRTCQPGHAGQCVFCFFFSSLAKSRHRGKEDKSSKHPSLLESLVGRDMGDGCPERGWDEAVGSSGDKPDQIDLVGPCLRSYVVPSADLGSPALTWAQR